MLSELDDPQRKDKVIAALEVKLALAKGEQPKLKSYQSLLNWYDCQLAIKVMNAVPRTLYCKLSARQTKLIDDHSAAFGIPISSGSEINLFKVIQWFHSFVQKWGPKLTEKKLAEDRKEELANRKLELELRHLDRKMVAFEIEIRKREGTAVPIEEVKKAFDWLSAEWRKFGERMGKRYGPDAQRQLNEFLSRLENDNRNGIR